MTKLATSSDAASAPPGWRVVETIEGISTDDLRLLITSYPLSHDLEVDEIASEYLGRNHPELEKTTASAQLFRGAGGLIAHVDRDPDDDWYWIYAFGRTKSHATIARIGCQGEKILHSESERMLAILNSINLPDPNLGVEAHTSDTLLEAFAAGTPAILRLPEHDTTAPFMLGDTEALVDDENSAVEPFSVSSAELGSLARAFGAELFPGVTKLRESGVNLRKLDAIARQGLIARRATTFPDRASIRIEANLGRLIVTALHAALMVDISSTTTDLRTHTILVANVKDCFRLDEMPGEVFTCRPIDFGSILTEVLSSMDPVADEDSSATKATRIEIGRVNATGVVIDELSWVRKDDEYELWAGQNLPLQASGREEIRSMIESLFED